MTTTTVNLKSHGQDLSITTNTMQTSRIPVRWAPSLYSARGALSLIEPASRSAAPSVCTSSRDAQPYPQLAAANSHYVSSEDVGKDSVLHLDCFEVCKTNGKCIVKPKDKTWNLAFDNLFSRMITEYIATFHSALTCEAFHLLLHQKMKSGRSSQTT